MSASPSAAPAGPVDVARAARRVQLRRALTLLGMTLVLPGSAQLAAGNKRVGRIAIRVYLAVWCGVALLAALAMFWRTELLVLSTSLTFLALTRFALIALAIGWSYLIVDSWRLANPLGLAQGQRLAVTAVNGFCCFALAGGLLFASHLVAVQRDFIATVFGSGTVSDAEHGRYNVLLLGGDAGPNRTGVRPDSITLASIDEETGRTVLIGLPRNLADVPFPDGSPMHKEFPNGFDCDGCYLNGVYTYAADQPDLYPRADDPGIEATTQAVEAITGLSVNYYALIDLAGFRELVNAVGGVTINVRERTPIGPTGGPYKEWIETGRQKLDGYHTLWYARSRATSDDYSRMARQKCVMNAMLHQLDAKTVITNFDDIAEAGQQVISTSIPASQLATFIELSLKAKRLPVSSVSLVPPKVNTGDPDFDQIRAMIGAAIDRSEAKDDGDGGGGGKHGKGKKKSDANHSVDLGSAC